MTGSFSLPLTEALMVAIRVGDLAALNRALESAEPGELDIRDEGGLTPLLSAVREGWSAGVGQLLEAGADPNLGGSRVDYPLSASISRGHFDIAEQLLRCPALDLPWQGYIAACDALLGGDLAGLDLLLAHGFNLREPVPSQVGLSGAPDCASALLFTTISCGLPRPEVFERLIALGADPDVRSFGESQAGRLCSRANESPAILRQLLQAGAGVDELDGAGYAPLHYAASRDHLESAHLLLEFGADPRLKAADGSSPLLWAAANGRGRVHDLLRQNGAVPVVSDDLVGLPPCWQWDGGAAWGALELAPGDGAWHGVAWAPDEGALLSGLRRRYSSLRGSSPVCLVIRQLQAPAAFLPSPSLQPGRNALFEAEQTLQLCHYAPWFVQGISRPPVSADYHRFSLADLPEGAAPAGIRCVKIARILSFYEGRIESYATADCRRDAEGWRLTATP